MKPLPQTLVAAERSPLHPNPGRNRRRRGATDAVKQFEERIVRGECSGSRARTSPAWRLMAACILTMNGPSAFGATLIVTNVADSGPGTLRAHIAAATPDDAIAFGIPGPVVLNSELTISGDLFIYSGQPQPVRISGNNNSRVFNILGGDVFLYDLAITDGRVEGTNGAALANGETVRGGGILVGNGAELTLLGCVVSNNVAVGGPAGAGGVGGNGFGGGIANLGTLILDTSLVTSNVSLGGPGGESDDAGQAWGGALYTEGTSHVLGTTLHANRATGGQGGGGNGTAAGGGLYINGGTVTVHASTIVSNAAAGPGLNFGGGIDNYGTLTIRDSTIVGNQADFGGGITGGDIGNTILAGNLAGSGPDGSGIIASSDYNLIQDVSGMTLTGTTTHNLTGLSPMLGSLQPMDGPSLSFPLLTLTPRAGSPVIDKGKSFLTSDQRGFSRPYDGTVANAAGGNGADIGAIEIHPGTLRVINTADSGPGSLRQALSDNAGLGGGNTITFSNTVTGTIHLITAHLTLSVPAILRGPGPELLSISANQTRPVFWVLEGPSEISGLTIRDGLAIGAPGQGGQPNGSDERGGGIYNQATLTLSNCVILSNTVVGGVGADRQAGTVGNGGHGLGGGLYNASGTLRLVRTVFRGNRAQGGAGGNTSGGGGGGDGGEGRNGLGGALCTLGGTCLVIDSSFDGNQALGGSGGTGGGGSSGGIGGQGYGAGIYSESALVISNSTLNNGSAEGGPGGSGGTPGAGGSGYGGAIYNTVTLSLASSTIAGNTATGSLFDFGGGIYNAGILGVTNSTLSGNTADYGGGLSGDATAANTLFAGNTAGSGPDIAGTLQSQDYNLIQNLAGANLVGATAHTLVGVNPMLGPLQDNGGPTPTLALLPGSPAIDQGHRFGLTTDQRGILRPQDLPLTPNAAEGDGSDIGAFEFLPTLRLNIQPGPNQTVVLSWSADAANFRLQSVTNLPAADAWSDVTTPRVTGGGQVYTTNPAVHGVAAYRLIHP